MLELFEQDFELCLEKEPFVKGMRQLAWKRLQEMGLPTKKDEPFRYLPLDALYEQLRCRETIECDVKSEKTALTFIDGVFQEKELGSKAVIKPLDGALKQYGQIGAFETFRELCPFAFMNRALHEGGVFIYVPAGEIDKINIHSHFSKKLTAFPRIHLVLGRGAQLEIEERVMGFKQTASVIHMQAYMEESSELKFTEEIATCGWHMGSKRFELKKEAKLNLLTFSTGGQSIRQDVRVDLLEEKAFADLKSLNILRGSRQAHVYYHVRHLAPEAVSNQTVKNVVYDRAKSSFEGKIEVASIAQQTQSYQLNQNLLIGDLASAYCKPNLEIFADDVKASHGATIGRLDQEQIFYLKSRGVSENKAKQLLTRAFCLDLIEKGSESIEKNVMAAIGEDHAEVS